jgi:hypothetical protein
VSRTLPKRLGASGINAMRLVHKNPTGQPWDKPGHDARRRQTSVAAKAA